MPQARAEELTYYDELGIARNATPDQVREAFRALVRLLHPDHHTDEQLKTVAETQMRKLNRIYSVLSDPERRKAYDYLLEEDHGKADPLLSDRLSVLRSSRMVGRFAWVGAVVVIVILLSWLASEGPNIVTLGGPDKPALTSPSAETGARAPDMAAELARTRADLRIARFERDAAVHELEKLRGRTTSPVPSPQVETRRNEPAPVNSIGAMTELPSAPVAAQNSGFSSPSLASPGTSSPVLSSPGQLAVPHAAHAPSRALSGFWFYLKAPDDKKNPSLYPPEFIEATISEQNGLVKGRYRSRYRIADRAISPDVNFDFNGRLTGSTVTAMWSGPGGAHGDLTIRLLSDNSMRVEWTADQLGSIQGLTAGTAALTRRLD